MSENGLVGQPVADVIETLIDWTDDYDRAEIRELLDPITDDGVVTHEAVEQAVSDTSKVVATAETRAELAEIAYEDAVEAAESVDDLPIVTARKSRYTDRLTALQARVDGLASDLQTPVEQLHDPNAVYELAVNLRDVATTAQGVVRTADELAEELEEFERWLTEPDRRYDEFSEDIDLIEDSIADVKTVSAGLSADSEEPAVDWVGATMRARVLELLAADLRAEVADLQLWADREDVQFRTGLHERVSDVEQEAGELADTLAEHAKPAWRDRFEDTLSEFEEEVAGVEPPVDWSRVQEILENRQVVNRP
jgi:chromosome segregation ATPase